MNLDVLYITNLFIRLTVIEVCINLLELILNVEFIEVGKKEQALACLNDVINSKKHRTWTKVHQEIIFMHIQLCVETRNNNQCKEGLHQYKKICQQVNINSLDASIRHYLALAEEKANLARQESRDIVSALECEDLEQDVQTYEGYDID